MTAKSTVGKSVAQNYILFCLLNIITQRKMMDENRDGQTRISFKIHGAIAERRCVFLAFYDEGPITHGQQAITHHPGATVTTRGSIQPCFMSHVQHMNI